jgi:hypothetical protein
MRPSVGNGDMKKRTFELPQDGPIGRFLEELGRIPETPVNAELIGRLTREARAASAGVTPPVAPLSPRWRRRAMLTTFLSSLFGKLAIAATAVAATTGGLAATGNLPDPAQQWASDALARVGIEIPAPDRADPVLDAVFEGETTPADGRDYGEDVAEVASEGESTSGLERAADRSGNRDVADDYADVPDEPGDETGDVPQVDLPDQAPAPDLP